MLFDPITREMLMMEGEDPTSPTAAITTPDWELLMPQSDTRIQKNVDIAQPHAAYSIR